MSKLKKRREQLALTQKQVAERIEVDYQAYQQYEYGKLIPNAKLACKIARALETTVEELYGD